MRSSNRRARARRFSHSLFDGCLPGEMGLFCDCEMVIFFAGSGDLTRLPISVALTRPASGVPRSAGDLALDLLHGASPAALPPADGGHARPCMRLQEAGDA